MSNSQQPNIYIDFDDTIVESSKTFVDVYASMVGVTDVKYEKLQDWEFRDLFPKITKKDIYEVFSHPAFFNNLSFVESSKEVIRELSKFYKVNIVTFGDRDNLVKKYEYITDNLVVESPIRFIGLEEKKYSTKRVVDMSDGIFVDDRIDNLLNSNAKVKILFKNYKDFPWNRLPPNSDILVVNTWNEVLEAAIFFMAYSEVFDEMVR